MIFLLNFAKMGYVYICLLYGSQSALVTVDHNCCYIKLVKTAVAEFSLDPTKVAVTMTYTLNVRTYVTLKTIESDPSKYLHKH